MSSTPGVTASDWLSAYPPPRSLTLDQEALRVYQLAYYIGDRIEKKADPPISFTTLAAALLEGEDDTSKWFAGEGADARTQTGLGPQREERHDGHRSGREAEELAAAGRRPPVDRQAPAHGIFTSCP